MNNKNSYKNFIKFSLFEINFKKKIFIFPFISFFYLLIMFLILFFALWFIDSYTIMKLEKEKKLSSHDWVSENNIINKNNTEKLINNELFIWNSKGHNVDFDKKVQTRILVMGDSHVWGDGYANMNDIWWRQLEWELKKRGYTDLEIIASGRCGDATRWELEKAENILPLYNPDIIIWGFVSNDPDEGVVKQLDYFNSLEKINKEDHFIKILTSINEKYPKLFTKLIRHLVERRKEKIKVKYPPDYEKDGYPYMEWQEKLYEGLNWELYKGTVKKLSSFIHRNSIPQFFVTLPCPPYPEELSKKYSLAKELFEGNNILFFDTLYKIANKYKNIRPISNLEWGINPANGHPSKILTHFYAIETADILEEKYSYLLPNKNKKAANKIKNFYINDWVPFNLSIERYRDYIEIVYPENREYFLKIPYNTPFIQLNFEYPTKLSKVKIDAKDLQVCEIIINFYNPEKTDEKILKRTPGSNLEWAIKDNKTVNEIKIFANFNTTTKNVIRLFLE